jgi:hypothetical protein
MASSASHIVLFNDARYQQCNLRPGQRPVRYDHYSAGRLVGTLAGVLDDGLLDCGHSAPFGGIDFVRRREAVGAVVGLLRSARDWARAEGAEIIRVRARPGYFGANEIAVEFALTTLGAAVEACEFTLGLELWRYRTSDEYVAALGSTGRNRLTNGLRAGIVFAPAATEAAWAACYALLAQTKRRRDATMKIGLDYLLRLRGIFCERIAMHQLTAEGNLVAAALVYRIAPEWECLIAWGDDTGWRPKNVMNVLAYHLVRTALAKRVRVLDLGISSVDGVPDDNLIRFKRSIGATAGLRIDFCLPATAA